jgi:hypothetical protein
MQQYGKLIEPEYKMRPTWKLAWGLLWRQFVLLMPFYLIVWIIQMAVK